MAKHKKKRLQKQTHRPDFAALSAAHKPLPFEEDELLSSPNQLLSGSIDDPSAVGVSHNASAANGTLPTRVDREQQPEEKVCSDEDEDADLDHVSLDLSSSEDEFDHGSKFFKSHAPGSTSLAANDNASACPINSARFPTPTASSPISADVATPPAQNRSGDAILELLLVCLSILDL